MSSMKDNVTVKDLVTFTLNEADLTDKQVGEYLETARRDVPRSNGLQWWLQWFPAGVRDTAKRHVSVYLFVNKPVKAKYNVTVNGSTINHLLTYEFSNSQLNWGWPQYASHEKLRPLFRDGKLTMTCSIETDIEVPYILSVPQVFQLFEHVSTDVEIVVGSEKIPVHKNFISMISPVFHSMFSHNTAESKSGKADIIDFDFNTVITAIDICYGRKLEKFSVDTMVSVLRFADKYLITAVTNQYKKLPLLNLSIETFCIIVHYAYDCNKDALLTKCYNFFKEHQNEIKVANEFAELPPNLVVDVLKSAFDLKTDFDVLWHAHKNDISFVVEHIEQPFLKQITLQNFCPIVEYAWECRRDDLKKVCAEFYNDSLVEVMDLEEFQKLTPETMHDLVRFSYALKHDAK